MTLDLTGLTGRIIVPEDSEYDSARQDYNTFFDRFPLVIVFTQNTKDVSNAIKWSRLHKVPIRIRSGRHNYEGLSIADASIIIDVSEMKKVKLSDDHKTAKAQTGIRGSELEEELYKYNLVVPTGLCFTPRIAGYTLGGGQSAIARQYGLTIDQLLEIKMVDANGDILRANKDDNSDLFWALRGSGGGNFGVCTSYKFRTHPIDQVAYCNIGWNLSDFSKVAEKWQEYTEYTSDHRFTPLMTVINPIVDISSEVQEEFQEKFPGKSLSTSSAVTVQGVFLGPVAEFHKLLLPILNTGNPTQVFLKTIPWIEAVHRIGVTQPISPQPFKSNGPFVPRKLSKESIETIQHFIENSPKGNTVSILFHGLSGRIADILNTDTAYYYREALFNINPWATWNSSNDSSLGIHWVEELTQALACSISGFYVNSPDLYIRDWPNAYFGANFERLTKVKRKYDPNDVFHFPQSIPVYHKK